MKSKHNTLFLLLFLILGSVAQAQSPEGFNYQAVARDNAGELLANKSITVKTIILAGQSASNKVYEETHSVTTNALGHFSVVVGSGSSSDNFSSIKWAETPHHLKVEIDQGSGFAVMGTVQLQSVPYALHSKTAESAETVQSISVTTMDISDINSTGATTGSVLKWNGTAWVPGTDDNSGTSYTAGDGIDITSNVITAKSSDATWNANKIQGQTVDVSGAKTGQVLKFNGTSWSVSDDLNDMYTAGNGLSLTSGTFAAKNDDAMWNANKIMGLSIDNSKTPSKDDVLTYDGTKWTFGAASTGGSSLWQKSGNNIYYESGNVGINTDNPNTRLKVWDSLNHSSAGLFILGENILYGGLSSSGTYAAHRALVTGQGGAFAYGAINVSTGDIHSGGEGVGTYSIASGDGQVSASFFGSASGANTYNIGIYADASSGSNSGSGVNYGIFAIGDSANTNYAGYFIGDVNYTGNLTNASDAKLKYDVNGLQNATALIKELAPKSYYYKQEGEAAKLQLASGLQYGFIAQELEEVLPNLVKNQVQMNGFGKEAQIEYKAVNYIGLIPVLTQALKEQQEYIESLEERLIKLEEAVNNK